MDAGSVMDSGAPDADVGLTPFGIRLAYFPGPTSGSPAFADLCFQRFGETTWTRGYNAPGIGQKQVGKVVNLPRGTYEIRLINVGQTCDMPFFQTSVMLGNDSTVNRPTLLYKNGLGPSVASTTAHREDASDLVGKDRLRLDLLPDPGSPDFGVSFVEGGMKKTIGSFLDVIAGTVGKVLIDYLGATPDVEIPYRAGSGVATSLFVIGNGSTVLFCDNLGPPSGILALCSTTLRMP